MPETPKEVEKIYDLIYTFLTSYGEFGVILAGIIFVLFVSEIVYYVAVYGRVASFRLLERTPKRDKEPAISVVVPMFVEDSDYLDNGLVRLLTQDYNDFEVVVVYVGHDDDFFADLQCLTNLYSHLHPVHIDYSPHYPVSSKIALNVGFKSAKKDFVVMTTTSATPSSERWLSLLAKGFLYGDIVLGYSGVEPKSGFLNFIFREYRFTNSVAWLSSAIRGRAYSASRNALGFAKELYFNVRGFGNLNMNVGEDDLFLQQIATRDNVSVVLSPRATTVERTWGGWSWWIHSVCEQHRTHRFYPKRALLSLRAEIVLRVLFFVATLVALVLMPWEYGLTVLGVALLRYLVVFFVVVRNTRRLGEVGLASRHFIYDFIEPVLRLVVAISFRKKRHDWL